MTEQEPVALLESVRVLDCSMLAPSGLGQHLADLGADVIKVEAPGNGDYVRKLAWPIVRGNSLLHWRWNRGKRSLALDLRTSEGVEVFEELVCNADVVVEGMRPGALARRGLGYDRLRRLNPAVVFCALSGYGGSGPYRDMASHGIAYDAIAGLAPPGRTPDGFPTLTSYTQVGSHAAPLFGALGVLAAVIRARQTGEGVALDVAQSDAAVVWNWMAIESAVAEQRPDDEVTGNDGDGKGGERRAYGAGGMAAAVRYQYYETSDGHVLFQASERKFWRNFCVGIGREDLYDRAPGKEFADHARGDHELRRTLAGIFAGRSTAEWVEFGREVDTPIAPVYAGTAVLDDPQLKHRIGWLPAETHGVAMMRTPVRLTDAELAAPGPAPSVGEHGEQVLTELLGYDETRLRALRAAGAIPDTIK
ncbi:CaiB/BaiF CoA transferase family protein [Amycolatopsis taiwanensis]|uniref:CoA transferase n=1 Tax=Amycolatopsis taiwanensis TaxID=342230 RepID=A0A9W6VJA0_9PSEU|nr:CaiB/BaiF CoA-transferase family protein [Amycolatopsis taiwanensis]GLY70505.1 CoA transferase [Amycolatopsis taiwanensis]